MTLEQYKQRLIRFLEVGEQMCELHSDKPQALITKSVINGIYDWMDLMEAEESEGFSDPEGSLSHLNGVIPD